MDFFFSCLFTNTGVTRCSFPFWNFLLSTSCLCLCFYLYMHASQSSWPSSMIIRCALLLLLLFLVIVFHLHKMEFFHTGHPRDNKALVQMLHHQGIIKSSRVVHTMEEIDRKLFVPEGRHSPYMDSPLPIGYNATISAPHMHGLCLQLLDGHLRPGAQALDIGSGTGYLTACFAVMVGERGRAVGVEHIPELVESSIENVKNSKAASLLRSGRLSLHVGDGRNGWPEEAPYDAIHVGAAASEVPDALYNQLKPGGRMVIPVGDVFQDLRVIDKQADGSLKEWSETSVRYVPLTSKREQLQS